MGFVLVFVWVICWLFFFFFLGWLACFWVDFGGVFFVHWLEFFTLDIRKIQASKRIRIVSKIPKITKKFS